MKRPTEHIHTEAWYAMARSLVITLVLVLGLAPVWLFPGTYYPACDVTDQLLPFLHETRRMLSSGAPWWTWQSFMGDNFIGSYAYYTLVRPLLLAVCLLPYKWLGAGLAAYIYVNMLVTGWLSSCYLRMMDFDRRLRFLGSLLFTLSCYMLCQLNYCMFFEPVQAFLILLMCIERFLKGRRLSSVTLALASFAVVAVNYYMAVATLPTSAMYFICRGLQLRRGDFAGLLARAAGCVATGIVMASVLLVPVAAYLAGTPRTDPTSGVMTYVYGNNWAVRLLSLVAPLPQEGHMRLYDVDTGYYMNMANVGIFGLFAFVLYAAGHRRSWPVILCAIFMVCLVTPVNSVFSLFTHPYYTRWTYALTLMLIVVTLSWLRERGGGRMPRRPALVYCAVVTVYFLAVYSYGTFVRIVVDHGDVHAMWNIYAAAILFLVNTGALLLLTRWPVMSRRWMRACTGMIVLGAVVQLLSVVYGSSLEDRGDGCPYSMLREMTAEREESDTFRSRTYYQYTSSNPWSYANHHLMANRQSVSSYLSTLNPTSVRLSYLMANSNTWHMTLRQYHESALTLLSVNDFRRLGDFPFTGLSDTMLRGDRYIPMGMAYDRYSIVADSFVEFKDSIDHDVLRGMLASLTVSEEDEPELSRYMTRTEFCETLPLDSLVAARRAHTCETFAGDTRGFTATVELPDTMVVMFSVAADPGFTATIDGRPSKIYNVNFGMSASVVPAGRHTIRYEYFPPGLRLGAWLSLAGLAAFLALFLIDWHRDPGQPHQKS